MPSAGGTPFVAADYDRYIEILDSDVSTSVLKISDKSDGTAICKDASFELLRMGGCGGGDFSLISRFPMDSLDVGMYVQCRLAADGDPVYLGRIEEITVDSPSGVSLRTQGPMSLLNGIRAGGFDSADLALPHLYAASDYFIWDPDHNLQSWDFVDTVPGLIQKIFDQYISIRTSITLGEIYDYSPSETVPFDSAVFRGQETLGQIIRTLGMQQNGSSWGVNASNEFFFIPRGLTEIAAFQEGEHLSKLSVNTDMELLFNELLITGDYVYDNEGNYLYYRWVSAHASASSISAYGPRKTTLYLPWIRTFANSQAFADAFFEIYAEPRHRYTATTLGQGGILLPWEGTMGLIDRTGADIVRGEMFDRVEVEFNQAPILKFTLGPEDVQYPMTPILNRWEVPE